MHESIRAGGQSRSRLAQPTSEDWHELSRYVAATRAASAKRVALQAGCRSIGTVD